MVSFKVKLAVYFLLLSLLPVAAAFWGFSSVASQSETRRVDARLQGGLRAALAAYQERLDTAQVTAETLAREPAFQEALSRSDRRTVSRRLRGLANVEVLTPLGLVVGRNPGFAAKRQVDVFSRNGLFVGTVIAFVPYDTRLATRLHSLSGLPANDSVAILDGTHIAAASPAVFGRLTLAPGLTRSVGVGGARYRALVAGSLQEDPLAGARLAVLSPQNVIDRANGSTRTRLLLFLVGSLLIVAIVAWIEGRSIVRTLRDLVHAAHAIARGRLDERVPLRGRDEFSQLGRAFNDMADQLEERLQELEAERARLREAFARIGDALGSTHDPAGLLQVVLETALQATGATGAVLVGDRGEHVEVGDPAQGPERLEVPLSAGQTSFGTLVLTGSGFSEEQKLTAISLAAQAVVALENARLHRIVEHQALVDPLTGLANRRRCEEALSVELARAERFGTPLTFVLADLDDFKTVNDDHGHPVGDVVLREFAAVLRENVREADLAGRWGGEEFVLLLPGTDGAGGAQLAERVRTALLERTILAPNGSRVEITCSFGISDVAAAPEATALVAAADRALYRAKRGGKNRVETTAPLLQHP